LGSLISPLLGGRGGGGHLGQKSEGTVEFIYRITVLFSVEIYFLNVRCALSDWALLTSCILTNSVKNLPTRGGETLLHWHKNWYLRPPLYIKIKSVIALKGMPLLGRLPPRKIRKIIVIRTSSELGELELSAAITILLGSAIKIFSTAAMFTIILCLCIME